MGRLCTVCAHPKREAIDEALLVHSEGYRAVACRFGVGRMALQRHEHAHLHFSFTRSKELAAMVGVQTWMAPMVMEQGSRKKQRQ